MGDKQKGKTLENQAKATVQPAAVETNVAGLAKDVSVGKTVNTKDSRPSREGAVRNFVLEYQKTKPEGPTFDEIVNHLKEKGFDPAAWTTGLKQSFGLLKKNLKNKGFLWTLKENHYTILVDPDFVPKPKKDAPVAAAESAGK